MGEKLGYWKGWKSKLLLKLREPEAEIFEYLRSVGMCVYNSRLCAIVWFISCLFLLFFSSFQNIWTHN